MYINENAAKLSENYLFAEVAQKVKGFSARHPEMRVIRLDIGDVTLPVPKAVSSAMNAACDELAEEKSFRGYSGEHGYEFLKSAISEYYRRCGVKIFNDEISVCDGAKSEIYALLELAGAGASVLITNPVYPMYTDAATFLSQKTVWADAVKENGFLPMPDEKYDCDVIILCSPNNPTGAAYTRDMLKKWVDFANSRGAFIIFDGAYSSFVQSENIARSIYEIEGASSCAVEVRSLSKSAGFTGIRCGWSVIPREFAGKKAWNRIKPIRSNGVSYITQRGAEAALSDIGISAIKKNIDYYRQNAEYIKKTLDGLGLFYTGGTDSPYIFFECPYNISSQSFFDRLLSFGVSSTPGIGFGKNGENFVRLTAFGSHYDTVVACKRLESAVSSF